MDNSANLTANHTFEHPLLAQKLILGSNFNRNSGLESQVFRSKPNDFFKGIIQDLRINNHFLPFFEDSFLNSEKIFGARKLTDKNLLAVCFF